MQSTDHSIKQKLPGFKAIPVFLGAVVILTALDQVSKYLAVRYLKDQTALRIIPGVLELQYLENRGAAFGMMRNMQVLFILFACIITAAAFVFFLRLSANRRFLPLRIICILISAGAIGNMIDRIRLGYVIDFLYVSLIDFPIFNVADIYVTVGCAALIILLIFVYKEEDHLFDE